MKSNLYILALFFSAILFCQCLDKNKNEALKYFSIQGETMGTYYNIKYSDALKRNLKPQVDSILIAINQSLSTYISDSYISTINTEVEENIKMETDPHFIENYKETLKLYQKTEGLYDPTVGAMTNYYGFGKDKRVLRESVPEHIIDSLKALVGMNKTELSTTLSEITIKKPINLQIDFSSIAKGYAVDQISKYLLTHGCHNHLVDIGGDGLAKGISPTAKDWTIGINKPIENSALNDFALVLNVVNNGLATSGNYRNFYRAGKKKYAHTINPITGLPEITTLLSTSIIAENCMKADAYATACMVMGLEKSKDLINTTPGIEACWIHDTDQDGKLEMSMSDGFHEYVKTD